MNGAGVTSNAGLNGSIVINERNFDITRPPTSFGDVMDGSIRAINPATYSLGSLGFGESERILGADAFERIGDVKIIGNVVTRDNVIRRQTDIYPGQILAFKDLEIPQQRLSRLGIFDESPKPNDS